MAAELRRVAAALTGAQPSPPPPTVDRQQLFDVLCRLLDAAFEELLFRVNAPTHLLPSRLAPRAERTISLIQWAEAQTAGLDPLVTEARRHAPGTLP